MIRLRELAVYSASDTIGDEEREFLDQEFQSLTSEFDRIARSTTFGNKKLLTGTGEKFSFQVGANRGDENTIQFTLDADTTSDEVGIDGLGVADKSDALDALDELDSALLKVAGTRASFGAVQSRFQFAIDNLSVQADNIEQARSLIVDVDVAEEVTKPHASPDSARYRNRGVGPGEQRQGPGATIDRINGFSLIQSSPL